MQLAVNAIDLSEERPAQRHGPLAAAVLLHLGLLFVIQSGLLATVQTSPVEAVITLLTPENETPAPAPQVRPAVREPAPVKRTVTPTPAPTPASITAPSAPAEPAAAERVTAPVSSPQPAPSAPPRAEPKLSTSVEYVQAPRPDYPALARRAGEQGKVTLRILVNEHGQPERADVENSSGFGRLDEAAKAAALRALFKPHTENGRPVPVYVIVPINFTVK